jgi:hypothetical protein
MGEHGAADGEGMEMAMAFRGPRAAPGAGRPQMRGQPAYLHRRPFRSLSDDFRAEKLFG